MITKYIKYKIKILEDERSQKLIFKSDGRNHYTYRISDLETDKHYYGSRVTKLNPTEDLGIKYFSSSSNKEFISNQKLYPHRFKYKVLRISDNPGDNILFESYVHQYFQVSNHKEFLNQSNQTPFGWSTTGNTRVSKKIKETNSKIDPETGLTGYQMTTKKVKEINSQINPETGLTGYQMTAKKVKEINSQIDPETGLTGYQTGSLKRKETLSKIDPETGLTGYQMTGLLVSAERHANFRGYFIVLGIKYPTILLAEQCLGISASSILRYCRQNNLKILSNLSYSRSKFLQSLGSREDIVGKTPRDLGFKFEYIKTLQK